MKIWGRLLLGIITAMACLGLELYSYPWSVYYGNFTYGAKITQLSYMFPSVIAGLVVVTALSIIARFPRVPALDESFLTGGVLLATFLLLDVLLGPMGVEVYHTRVRGIFFAEWNFINFFVYVALPISALVACMVWLAARRSRKRPSLPL
jgi:hypothetical protein